MKTTDLSHEELRAKVRENYGKAANKVMSGESGGCCGSECGCSSSADAISSNLYPAQDTEGVPKDALAASLGCANPVALAKLSPGETVLDLGSGGGIDVLMSAKRVGPEGLAYGLDMTDEMLALAEMNRREAGAENVKFLKGTIENIPLPDNSVDVIISNCVINLSADKSQVLREAFRVLGPGGRIAVADIVAEEELPEDVRENLEAYAGCVAGALTFQEYERKLSDAGFAGISIESVRSFGLEDGGGCCGSGNGEVAKESPKIHSAHVRAVKPKA